MMILNVISMMMIKMIVGQLKLVAVLEGEPFAGAFGKKYQSVSMCVCVRAVYAWGASDLFKADRHAPGYPRDSS